MKDRLWKTSVVGAAFVLAATLSMAAASSPFPVLDPGVGGGHVIAAPSRPDAQLQEVLFCGNREATIRQVEGQVMVTGNPWDLLAAHGASDSWIAAYEESDLEEVIAAYDAWFCNAGAEMALATGTASVRQTDVSGAALDPDLRVVFATVGSGVRVYLTPY